MIRAVKVILLGTCLLSAAAYGTLITFAASPAAMGANDSVTWGQLGTDSTVIANTFSATSSNLLAITGAFTGLAGMVVTAGGPTWSTVTGAFTAGDSLLWSFDHSVGANAGTGPLTINFPTGFGAGAAIQPDAMGQFTAQIQLYSGLTFLGSESVTSDANGDAIFIGAVDNVAEVTSAVFSLTAEGRGNDTTNNMGDFTIDTLSLRTFDLSTPEPGSVFLLGGALAILGSRLRRRAARS